MSEYINGISKTGFILEYSISQILRKNGWAIISNKYYEDDLSETVREMDILAYKATTVSDISIYTTLIVSCKKSEDNVWGLIARDINLTDPNSNWFPLHSITNDPAIRFVLDSKNINKEYYHFMSDERKVSIMEPLEVDVFAFQELNKKTGTPQNDKNIFNSITTLMKAQSYEMGVLDARTKINQRVYQFNLISIIDSQLIRLHLKDVEISEKELETEQIVTRYIIKKKEQFFRIRFFNADTFSTYIESYNTLHQSNIEFFTNQRNLFYKNIVKDQERIKYVLKDFTDGIIFQLIRASDSKLSKDKISREILIVWEEYGKYLRIFVTDDEDICKLLNEDKTLMAQTKLYLSKVFRFDGDFKYDTDNLPF